MESGSPSSVLAIEPPGDARERDHAPAHAPGFAIVAACVVLAAVGAGMLVQWRGAAVRAEFQRAFRAVLVAGAEGDPPATADLEIVARHLESRAIPRRQTEQVLAMLRTDPLSKDRWRELRQLL